MPHTPADIPHYGLPVTTDPAPLEVRILGPFEARVDGRLLPLGGGKQRTLVALLAVYRGETVPVDRIIDELWGQAPPASAAQSVQMHVSRLRRVLASEVGGDVIVTAPGGYALAPTASIDARRFEALLTEGQASRRAGDLETAREQLAAALELWRAEALTGVERGHVLSTEAGRLDALQLVAQLDRIECDMALGAHHTVVAELEALARRHPLQERIRALLMTALYRGGRQAEALEVYRDTRRLLMDELGLEPTQQLQDLEVAILRQDRALAAPVRREQATPPPPAEPSLPRRRLRWAALALTAVAAAGLGIAGLVAGEQRLGRIDADAVGVVEAGSGRVVAQVRTGGRPVSLATTPGAVWVADGDRGLLVRIEPAEVRTVDTVPIGPGTTAVGAGAGAVWVVASNARTVSRVNLDTNSVVRRIAVGNGARAVAVGAGNVWVANGLDGTVSQIDPKAGRELRRVPVGALPSSVAVGAGAVWVANETDGTVTRIDPSRGAPVTTIRVGNGAARVVVTAGAVWVANAADGTLSRIDPRTNAVTATVPVGERPVAVAAADGAVWVAGTDGLRRVDPRSVQVTRRYRVGASPSALVTVGEDLWAAAEATPAAHRGGTLHLAAETESPSLDPALAESGDRSVALLSVVANGLVGHRRAGGAAGAALVADLARALPDRSDGGLTYRFQLRPGLRYGNGAPVRARDVQASIERLHRMEAEALGIFPLGLRGEGACGPRGCDLSAGITTDDATGSVTFHLQRPNPDFLVNLAVPAYAVLPAGSPPRDLTGPALVGTGPYRIASVSSQGVTLERNPRFRVWSNDAQPDGFADRIVWKRADDPAADVRMDPTREELARLAVEAPIRVRKHPISYLVHAWLNTTVAPFDRLDARRAVAAAVDRSEFLASGSGALANRVTCQLLSPGFPGHHPSCMTVAPDLDRARRLVKRSGTAGMRVRFWVVRDDDFWGDFGRRFVRTLRRIGYDATLAARLDPRRYVEVTLDAGSRAQAGGNAWFGDKPSASNVIKPLLGCPRGNSVTFNQSHFCDPGLDASMQRAHRLEAAEPAAANAIWAGLDRELVRRAPIVPVLSGETVQVTSERLGNYQYHLRYGPLVAQAWVE